MIIKIEVKINLISLLIVELFLISVKTIKGKVAALPKRNDSGRIIKLTTYANEMIIKFLFISFSDIFFNK
jgi:hypothetical protein